MRYLLNWFFSSLALPDLSSTYSLAVSREDCLSERRCRERDSLTAPDTARDIRCIELQLLEENSLSASLSLCCLS